MSTPLPPPDPSTFHAEPGLAPRRRRGRTALAAAAGAAATVGLLGIVPAFVSASSSTTSTSIDTSAEPADPPASEPTTPSPDDTDDGAPGDVIECSGSISVILGEDGVPVVSSDTNGDCTGVLPHVFPIDDEAMAEFEACMEEVVGDVAPPFDPSGTVSVDDGTDAPALYDFGEGDGTITVTKTGDDINVTTSGDVDTLDLGALDELWAEHAEQFESCNELLPDLPDLDLEVGGHGPLVDLDWGPGATDSAD
jgi:hypothetical protein